MSKSKLAVALAVTALLASACGSSTDSNPETALSQPSPSSLSSINQPSTTTEVESTSTGEAFCLSEDSPRAERSVGNPYEENKCPEEIPTPSAESWAESLKSSIKIVDLYLTDSYSNLYTADNTTPTGALCWAIWEIYFFHNQLFWWANIEGYYYAFPEIQDEVTELTKNELNGRSVRKVIENIYNTSMPQLLAVLNAVGIGTSEIEWLGGQEQGNFAEALHEKMRETQELMAQALQNSDDILYDDYLKIIGRLSPYHEDISNQNITDFIVGPEPEGCGLDGSDQTDFNLTEALAEPVTAESWAEVVGREIRDFENYAEERNLYLNKSDRSTPYGAFCWSLGELSRHEEQLSFWDGVEGALTRYPELLDEVSEILKGEIAGRSIKGMLENFANTVIPEVQKTLQSTGMGSDSEVWPGDPAVEEYGVLLIKNLDIKRRQQLDLIEKQDYYTREEMFAVLHASDLYPDTVDNIYESGSLYRNMYSVLETDPEGCHLLEDQDPDAPPCIPKDSPRADFFKILGKDDRGDATCPEGYSPTYEESVENARLTIAEFDFYQRQLAAIPYAADKTDPVGALCWASSEMLELSSGIYFWRSIDYFLDAAGAEGRQELQQEISGRSLDGILKEMVLVEIPAVKSALNGVGIGTLETEWQGDEVLGNYGEKLYAGLVETEKMILRGVEFGEAFSLNGAYVLDSLSYSLHALAADQENAGIYVKELTNEEYLEKLFQLTEGDFIVSDFVSETEDGCRMDARIARLNQQ